MGASYRTEEQEKDDAPRLYCWRCTDLFPWHDMVETDGAIDRGRAWQIIRGAVWVDLLCSYCWHMTTKDD